MDACTRFTFGLSHKNAISNGGEMETSENGTDSAEKEMVSMDHMMHSPANSAILALHGLYSLRNCKNRALEEATSAK